MEPVRLTAPAPRPAPRPGRDDAPVSPSARGGDLLPASWRRYVAPIVAASVVWVTAWGVAVHGGRRPVAVERPFNDALTGLHPQLVQTASAFAALADPPVFAGLMLVMLGLCVWGRSVRAAITLVVALVVTLGLVEVGKVVVGRVNTVGMLTFPSGHVGAVSVLASVVVLLARRHGPLGRRLPQAACVAIVAVALASVVAVAASMVILGDHFVTDTTAAAPIGLSVTLAVAAVADRWARRGAPGH